MTWQVDASGHASSVEVELHHGRTDGRTDVEVGRGSILTHDRTRRGAAGFGRVSADSGSPAASRGDVQARRLADAAPKPPLRTADETKESEQ